MDPETAKVLQTLVALGRANPQNSAIFNMVTGQASELLKKPEDEVKQKKSKISDAITSSLINKYAESGDASYLKNVDSLLKGADPFEVLQGGTAEQTDSVSNAPDELREQILGEKYKSAIQKAVTSNDYSEVEKLKQDNPDYSFDSDESGNFTVQKAEKPSAGMAGDVARMLLGDTEAEKAQIKQDYTDAAGEYYRNKYGIFGDIKKLGAPSKDDEIGLEEFLKGKGKSKKQFEQALK